jgi:hypothetical protein
MRDLTSLAELAERLSDQQRHLLLDFIWLYSQATPEAQMSALAKVVSLIEAGTNTEPAAITASLEAAVIELRRSIPERQ